MRAASPQCPEDDADSTNIGGPFPKSQCGFAICLSWAYKIYEEPPFKHCNVYLATSRQDLKPFLDKSPKADFLNVTMTISEMKAALPAADLASEHAEYAVTKEADVEQSLCVPSASDEKKLRRKLDLTILPWIMMLYFLSYMDR